MSAADPEPLFPHIRLFHEAAPSYGLHLMAQVVAGLCLAGEPQGADAFLKLAEDCDTEADLIDLIRCTVTLI